jgi:hypothetical protein
MTSNTSDNIKANVDRLIVRCALVLLTLSACNQELPATDKEILKPLPGVTDVLVDGENCRGAHITTRPHNRKVLYHKPSKTWIIFYGTGHWIDVLGDKGNEKEMIAWRASKDGVTFTPHAPAVVGNGHSSSTDVLVIGKHIILSNARFGYWRSKAGIPALVEGKPLWHPNRINRQKPNYFSPYEIFTFEFIGEHLIPGDVRIALPGDAHIGHAGPHYGSITYDTNGFLWVAGRALVEANGRLATWVSRTVHPNTIDKWEPHTVLFESAGPGTHAPQIIALDNGWVACVLFAKYEKKTLFFLYNPVKEMWGSPHVISKGYMSKRASAVFDSGSRRLHIVYTDQKGDARHRLLEAPFGFNNWIPRLNEPGVLVAEKAGANKGDDDLSLSVNLSKIPAPLALVHRGPDLRLHLKYYDGKKWLRQDVIIGVENSRMSCDEASSVMDFSQGLGFLYWCQWKSPKLRKKMNGIGQLRFCLVKDVSALFQD